MIMHNCGKYRVGADTALNARQLDLLKSAFDATLMQRDEDKTTVLGGRSAVIRMHLDGIGPAVVKPYTRGGIIRRFNRRTYLRTGLPRCRKEFILLERLRNLGVCAPAPVAFAYAGALLYQAWLVTKEIQNALPLAGLGDADPDRCRRALTDVGRQLSLLIANRILHVDLHPGNVLADNEGRAHLIDFDKARLWRWGSERLRNRYRRRWQRAVAKHGLPEILNGLPV